MGGIQTAEIRVAASQPRGRTVADESGARNARLGLVGLLRRFLPNSGYDVARIGFAAVLIVASLLKAHQTATDLPTQMGVRGPLWFKILLVDFELLFALWILANLYPRWTRLACLGVAAVFAMTSLYRWIVGEASCGCFGQVSVHPALTFALDLAIVIAFWKCPPLTSSSNSASGPEPLPVMRLSAVCSVSLAIGSPVTLWMMGYSVPVLGLTGLRTTAAQAIVLDPTDWVGKRCPLFEHVDFDGAKVGEGTWIVIVYDRNCHQCNEMIDERKRTLLAASESAAWSDWPRMAFVDVSPGHSRIEDKHPPFVINRSLHGSAVWAATVPTEIHLRDGFVVAVSDQPRRDE